MSAVSAQHLTAQQAEAYSQNRLAEKLRASVEAHLTICQACRRLVRGDNPTMATVNEVLAESVFDDHREFHAELSEVPAGLLASSKYRVVKKLGQGGMGVVYLAEQVSLQRRVVLKVIHPEHVRSEKAVSMLLHDARAAAKLSHPNVVATYDVEREGDTHFVVMGFVDGIDLQELVKRKGPHSPAHNRVHLGRKGTRLMVSPKRASAELAPTNRPEGPGRRSLAAALRALRRGLRQLGDAASVARRLRGAVTPTASAATDRGGHATDRPARTRSRWAIPTSSR